MSSDKNLPSSDDQAVVAAEAAPITNGVSEDPADAPMGDEQPVDAELEDKRMSLLEHLQELRVRLRNAGIAFIVSMIGSFIFVERFFDVLVAPTVAGISDATGKPVTFLTTDPTEGFWVMMKLAMIGGLVVAAPLVFWELWKFVAPGLYKKEKRIAGFVVGSTVVCFAGGSVFGYYVLSRPAAYFLTKMTIDFAKGRNFTINPDWRMEKVADYLMLTLAGCGAAFELPVILVLMGALGIVSARALWKFNKYALILAAVIGAVLTPSTDPFTQLLLAGPLYALYNLSILFVWLIERARKRKQPSDDDTAAATAA